MAGRSQPYSCRVVPPGVAVRRRCVFTAPSSLCSCSLNVAALFPDGPPSPPLPLSRCELHELLLELPQNLQNSPWQVCFDTEHDGFSLHNFYRVMKQVHDDGGNSIGLFLVTEDAFHSRPSSPGEKTTGSACEPGGVVLGCFTPEVPCLEHSQHAFFGSQNTFVFTYADVSRYADDACRKDHRLMCAAALPSSMLKSDDVSCGACPFPRTLSVYRWAVEGGNREFVVCANDFFGIGGGRDGAAIFVDSNLLNGTSSVYCGTFASPSLSGRPRATLRHSEFIVLRMVWLKVRGQKAGLTCMSLPTREPCDCGRLLENNGRGRVARLRCGAKRRGWHLCSDDQMSLFLQQL